MMGNGVANVPAVSLRQAELGIEANVYEQNAEG
jgi:hypothetical protein